MSDRLRSIPSVDRVLQALGAADLPRPTVTDVVRHILAELRDANEVPELELILGRIRQELSYLSKSRLRGVINATGILVHTNLGRAPLAPGAVEALRQVAAGYCNLEYDLNSGERGSRAMYLERQLALLCQAEAATAVNNGAAALVVALRYFTRSQKEVVISRGELIQIGGGFRIPEILEASGAKLREIGTTNQTSIWDYANAIGPETALILKVHRSNFYMDGFVDAPSTEALAALARDKKIALIEDLGSGAMVKTEQFAGLEHEPTPAEVLRRGVDLVIFSGDKLFGGPQAGIIAGRAQWVSAVKKEPFSRAVRCDKLVLAALQATVDLYLEQSTAANVPVLQMLAITENTLRTRAEQICRALERSVTGARAAPGMGTGRVGGGTLPRSSVSSVTVDLWPDAIGLEELSCRLRAGDPPVVGYVAEGRLKLDLRTVFPGQDEALIAALQHALQGASA